MEWNGVAEACYKISAFTVSALHRGAREQRCVSANDDDDDDDNDDDDDDDDRHP